MQGYLRADGLDEYAWSKSHENVTGNCHQRRVVNSDKFCADVCKNNGQEFNGKKPALNKFYILVIPQTQTKLKMLQNKTQKMYFVNA